MTRAYRSTVVFTTIPFFFTSPIVYPSPISVVASSFSISFCTEICLCSKLFLSPFSEAFTTSAISRRDQIIRAEHSTLMENMLLIYAVAQQSCTSYPLDNHVNAFIWKWEKRISKLYPCISGSVFPLFAEHLIQILSYSRTVKPNNQFWVLHIFHLNALGFLLICSGFNLSLGLALNDSSGILSSLLWFWKTKFCHLWDFSCSDFWWGGERRCCLPGFQFIQEYIIHCYPGIELRPSLPWPFFFESCFFCSHAFSLSLCCFQIYMHALPNKPQFS